MDIVPNNSKFHALSLNNCSSLNPIKKVFKADKDSIALESASGVIPISPINFMPAKYEIKIKTTETINEFNINPKVGTKYSPTPAGNSLIKALESESLKFVIHFFIIKNQPDKNAPSIGVNNTIAKIKLIKFPPIENKIYKLESNENNIKGVAKIMYLFVKSKLQKQ